MSTVDWFRADDEPRQAVDWAALLSHDDVRIGQRTAVEQVRRDHGVVAFERFPIDVVVGEQAPVP